MPHPNRFQSSSNLRLPPSQSSDTCLFSNCQSMSKPGSFSYNASLRRLGSRRPRPSAASIADIFVSSLVMAGHCREHSPRGRGLSTMSTKSSSGMGRWLDRGRTNTGQLSKKGLDYPGLPTGCLRVVHRSGSQRMFNSGIAQKVEDDEGEESRLPNGSIGGSSLGIHHKDTGLDRRRHFHGKLPDQTQDEPNCKPMTDPLTLPKKSEHFTPHSISKDDLFDRETDLPDKSTTTYQPQEKQSPVEELRESTARLYRAVFGESLDWRQALDTVNDEFVASSPSRTLECEEDTIENAVDLQSVNMFLEAMWDENISNQYVFRLYRELPHPGVSLLSKRARGSLLRRFANPPNRRWVDARRFLALIDDMVDAKLPVSRSLWTSAIHLAGRASGKVCKRDLVRAIGLWQKMEHIAGIKSDDVVFTILFDIALKAGHFTVADRLVEEMERRDITFRRPGKVSQIYYYGMRHDSDGVRQIYDAFVATGEIVDTAVLNCLIISFLRTGDTKTAEGLYRRMLQAQKTVNMDPEQWLSHGPSLASEFVLYRKKSRMLNRLLQKSPLLKEQLPDHHRALQEAIPLIPDTRTFHILLSHHAIHTGNLQAFKTVLGDMEKTYPIPPRGMIYLLLFDGFAHHGRKKKGWTSERLWNAWRAYLRALYESRHRYKDRFHFPTVNPTWENPLGNSAVAPASPTTSLYTALPACKSKGEDMSGEQESNLNDEIDDDIEELFGLHRDPQAEEGPLEKERQIENGVFLGRRMIIVILRAFGACCGPQEVMEVWLRIERLWQPMRRKAIDVLAVREELEKQMEKSSQRF
ncbi:hypothetical protein BDV25DRAFT_165948 [Aspergillus avenaceus]|uniref:Pentatricopeptide repeat protein n=1 Tax=Aspergillus avenaceus TaxID=36643 RepID=A0A5N6TEP0_ASPAV|nr:hypothetical protein BDV25DRAFT_165948 [Aspergillus avenaceus]